MSWRSVHRAGSRPPGRAGEAVPAPVPAGRSRDIASPSVSLKTGPVPTPEASYARAERLGFRAGRAGAGFAPAERTSAQRQGVREIQRKISLNGFGDGEAKRQDLFVALSGTDNRYLEFLRGSPYAKVEINLSPALDPNPGDSWILYKPDETGDWKYGTPEEIRGLKTIAGVGARVDIRKWYYDKYSSGKIVAMVAHELGVHIVPYLDEMMAKLPPEAAAPVTPKFIDETKTAPSGTTPTARRRGRRRTSRRSRLARCGPPTSSCTAGSSPRWRGPTQSPPPPPPSSPCSS